MKNKIIALISLILIGVILNMGGVVATDNQEINVEQSVDDNLDEINQQNTNINTNDDGKSSENSNLNNIKTNINSNSNLKSNNKKTFNNNTLKSSILDSQKIESTVVVDGSASNQMTDKTIQTAINNANPGDTIIITGENYVHCHFVINKKLTIISNIGTTMTPCPSNTQGSGSYGLFYISPEASGTIIQGFTLKNEIDDEKSYGIFVNGASDVEISNCIINTKYADGIRVENTNNIVIENSNIKDSKTGINIKNSNKMSIISNIITDNSVTGIYIGSGSSNININTNNITNNKNAGLTLYSGNYIYITNNFIAYNKGVDNHNSIIGAGIYVNALLTKVEIKGNYLRQNGLYGVLNGPKTTNMVLDKGAENLEVIDNNYFMGHNQRAVFHMKPEDIEDETYVYEGDTDIVYLQRAYLINEFLCPSTFKTSNSFWKDSNLNLKISEISQNKKGTYSVSIVDVNGNIASDISSIYVVFYLNKINNKAEPQGGDTYKIVLMKNGTATVTFNKEDYLASGNVLTACLPGLYDKYKSNPYATLDIADSEVPEDPINTQIIISNMQTTPNSGEYYIAKLIDKVGNPLANKLLHFKLNSNNYDVFTDSEGIAKLEIKLTDEKTYELNVSFDYDEPYLSSSAKANIIIKGIEQSQLQPQHQNIVNKLLSQKITSKNMVFAPKTSNYYVITLKDENNNFIKNKKVKFTINGKTYATKTNNKGVAKIKINLSNKKTYKIKIYSPATSKYNAVTKINKITIKKLKQKITSKNMFFAPKTSNYYVITLKDENNNFIKNKKITVKIGKKTYKKTTSKNGIVKIKINSNKTKTYKVTIKSFATSKYNAVTKINKITIKKLKQKITSSDKKYIPQSGEYYSITLKDQNNNFIKNKKVKFTINGKTYTTKTNNDGVAKLKINIVNEKVYNLKINSPATTQYKAITKTNKITIQKGTPEIISIDRTFSADVDNEYSVYLKDYEGKPLVNGKINFNINSNDYSVNTDSNGMAKVTINLKEAKQYSLIIKFSGDTKNNPIIKTNTITIKETVNTHFIDKDMSNNEIQEIIDNSLDNTNIEFLGLNYDNINLNVVKSLNIYSNIGTKLNGKINSSIFNITANNVKISNFSILVNSINGESNGIVINDANNVEITNNIISNLLDSNKQASYNDGSMILPGNGVMISNSKNILINNNTIASFESGIYNEYSNKLIIIENNIKSNNYGIKYGFGSFNTTISNNNITNNIGWYVMDVPEGPRGYGIFLNNSAVNITINQNNISSNYMGISIDANKSTGIVITSNLISENSLEGIRFNAGYDLADNVIEPVVSDNAIYRNAKGPSMMILGEMSANPEGIYGPGQWDNELKLKIGYNWYGTNNLRVWDNDTGVTGLGTMCPRINASAIAFKLNSNNPGTYIISFYKNGEIDNKLPIFDLYATLNRGTDKQAEVHFNVIEGVATFSFNKKNYLTDDNKLEISALSLFEDSVGGVYLYNVPNSEVPL